FDYPPEVLANKALETARRLGHPGVPAYTASGFVFGDDFLNFLSNLDREHAKRLLARGQPAPVEFWFRASPRPLLPWSDVPLLRAERFDPPMEISDMYEVTLDMKGRLTGFRVVAPELVASISAVSTPDWNQLFAAAGL